MQTTQIILKKHSLFFAIYILSAFCAKAQMDSLQDRIDTLEKHLQLKEVTITAKRPLFERKTDRLVFNVENSIINTGGDALEALRITPGLKVQNDQISMIAKSNMLVTVDDRVVPLSGEGLINYLKSIPTSSIKSIEVITTPPAKYDAEANSGIVNIVLKKNSINSWNLDLRESYTQATYPDNNFGLDLNYKKNRLALIAGFSYGKGKDLYQMKNMIYYSDETWIMTSPFKRSYKYFRGNIGLDYEITKNWKIGVAYFGHWSYNPLRKDSIITNIFDLNNNLTSYMIGNKINKYHTNINSINVHSINKLDSLGKKISVDFDYFVSINYDSRNNYGASYYPDNTNISDSYYANISQSEGKVSNFSAKIDFEFPFSWANINCGGKLSFSQNNNDYLYYDNSSGVPIIDTTQTNAYCYRENIQAVYVSASKKITKNLESQVGLRLENTHTEGYSKTINQTDKNNYLKLFPTAYLVYRFNDERSLSLSYSRRISRPSFYNLNPYKSYFNASDYYEGNPFLKPSYSNNLELVYNSKSSEHKLWYSYFSDDIYTFPFVDETTKIVKHYPVNCINYYSIGVSESYNYNNIWWWNSYNNAVCYYIRKTATIPDAISAIHKFSGNFTSNNDFMLNKGRTIMLNVGFYYEFPHLEDYVTKASMWYTYAGIKMRFLNNNLTIALTYNDIFKTNHSKSTVVPNNIRYVYDNLPDSRYVRLSVSYKFGNKKIWVEKHKKSNEEILDRVK